uniref:LysM domain-containing protein n=1 Tax=candidate division WOR-3 bacterium TaxID=2052148 RepID=A0A7C4Y4V0_UNCW3
MKKILIVLAILLLIAPALNAAEKKLKPEEAQKEIQNYMELENQLKQQIENEKLEIEALKGEIAGLETKINELKSKIEELKSKPVEVYYIVKWGDWLSKLAEYKEVYGKGQYRRWRDIYNANKNLIKDPDLILPGWKLIIPKP